MAIPKFGLARGPATHEELWWAIRAMWGITVPRTQVCPHHSTPFAALAQAYFAEAPVSVWWASRGYGGKSFLLSVLTLSEAAFMGAACSLLGGSGAQSLNVHEHTLELWAAPMAPRSLIIATNKFGSTLTNKGAIRTLMASQTSVRGPHPQRLRMDEIDEMDYEILKGAQGQPMRKRGIETQTVMSSTWQYPDKTMSIILDQAKEKNWPVHAWCYKETSNPIDGWLAPDEVERKKLEIPKAMWETEYELQEPNVENRAIDPELVRACFGLHPHLVFSGESPVQTEEPERGNTYVTGADWAKTQDRTIVATFRLPDWHCVAWQAIQRQPWQVMVDKAYRQWQAYGGTFVHDATGLGSVVDDLIKEKVTNKIDMRRVIPVTMSRGVNNAMYSEYISAIERGDLRYPMIELAYDEHRYVTIDDLFGSGHTPDSFVAGALAWTQRKSRVGIVADVVSTKKQSNWTNMSVGFVE